MYTLCLSMEKFQANVVLMNYNLKRNQGMEVDYAKITDINVSESLRLIVSLPGLPGFNAHHHV